MSDTELKNAYKKKMNKFSVLFINYIICCACFKLKLIERLVPVTDDKVMEVKDFLIDDKTEIQVVVDAKKTAKCILIGYALKGLHVESSS